MGSSFETVTQLGQERGEVQAPTREQLSDVFQGVDIYEHKKPSVFAQACKDICRLGYDHSGEVASGAVLTCLGQALGFETNDREGPKPIAAEALKALAVLTSHPGVRELLRSIRSPLDGSLSLLRAGALDTDIEEIALTVLGNLAASRIHAEMLSQCKGLAEVIASAISPVKAEIVQNRALTLATNLALSAPSFSLAFADAGGVRAAAALVAASPRHVQPATQARAAALLAALARLPALAAALADAVSDAPELAIVVRDALAEAADDRAGAAAPASDGDPDGEDTSSVATEEQEAGIDEEASGATAAPAPAASVESSGAAVSAGA
eukprot:jgi/Ulvmu1/3900/UM018_0122.1